MTLYVGPHHPVENIQYIAANREREAVSQIVSAHRLSAIEDILQNVDEETLVLWDVDQTLIVPDDAVLRPKWEKQLDQWMGGKKVAVDAAGNKRYIFREILMSAPHSILDQGSAALIAEIQKKGARTIAFSAAPGGKIGNAEKSFVDWRIEELERFGFDFSSAFSNVGRLELPKDPEMEFPPIFQSGVLITSLHDKGPVLRSFFDALQWQPKKIVFIDDQMSNLQSVAEALNGQGEFIGVHYTAASQLPCALDEKAAKRQIDHFIQSSEWISQEKANLLAKVPADLYPRIRPVDERVLPTKFRATDEAFLSKLGESLNRTGLEKMKASASSQFSEESLKCLQERIGSNNIMIVDTRRELHGFLNGYPISWKLPVKDYRWYRYNDGLSVNQIETIETAYLQELLKRGPFQCATDEYSVPVFPERVETERQLATKLGMKYLRIPILDNEFPLDAEVDQFVRMVKSLPDDMWIHFHCAGGEGRTTQLMCMLDMMRNSHSVGASTILQRQEAIGGSNLARPEIYYLKDPSRVPGARERLAFLLSFSLYCLGNPDFAKSWSEWKKETAILQR